MSFEIYRFTCNYPGLLQKEGFLLESSDGVWSEVSPSPRKNRESLQEALEQLQAIQQGWKGPLFPSVALGLYSLEKTPPLIWPVCLFLAGSPAQILKRAEATEYTTAKVKLGDFDLPTAVSLTRTLIQKFRLRIDIQEKWTPEQTLQFCSYFAPTDFDFIEDPGCDISPHPMKTESTTVWKPMVRGIPPLASDLILSSTFESGVGIAQIVALAHRQQIPLHPLGIGTYLYLEEDLLEEPLTIQNGYLHTPLHLRVKKEKLLQIRHEKRVLSN